MMHFFHNYIYDPTDVSEEQYYNGHFYYEGPMGDHDYISICSHNIEKETAPDTWDEKEYDSPHVVQMYCYDCDKYMMIEEQYQNALIYFIMSLMIEDCE